MSGAPLLPPSMSNLSSGHLVRCPLRDTRPTRASYLALGESVSPPPLISASPFVPRSMIEHLMRCKKDLALGVKYDSDSGVDAITNVEGAMHTFVTPVCQIFMHGDYVYRGQHTVDRFERGPRGEQLARVVVMSAMVHPDFEFTTVMFRVAALGDQGVLGEDLGPGFTVPSQEEKQDAAFRDAYDERLRRHLVKHLTAEGRLPAASVVKPLSDAEAVRLLSEDAPPLAGRYVTPPHHHKAALSLELLFGSAVQQVVNEFSALEACCSQGYVYTFDPPAIFAATLGATLLNRLFIAALSHVAVRNIGRLKNMRVFAFNDYADQGAIELVKAALKSHPHVVVMAKSALFPPPGKYVPPAHAEDAMLVLHNNSDAFGQNIEFEASGGSMDGAIGCNSNAAACLSRSHPGLVNHILDQSLKLDAGFVKEGK